MSKKQSNPPPPPIESKPPPPPELPTNSRSSDIVFSFKILGFSIIEIKKINKTMK